MLLTLVLVLSCNVSESHLQDTAAPVQSSPSTSLGFGYARQWGSIGGLSSPNGVAVDNAGNLYLADVQNYAVGEIASNGTFVAVYGGYGTGPGQFNNPLGVAVDSSGNVFATDSSNNNVQEFSRTGVFVRSWNSNGTANGSLLIPRGIAVNSTGFVYVVDQGHQRVGVFRNDGSFVKYFCLCSKGQPEPGNFTQAMGLAIDVQGSVYVDDSNTNRNDGFAGNVTKFTMNGGFLMSWGGANLGGSFFTPQGLAVDNSFNVYVADSFAARIQKYDAASSKPSLVWSAGSYGVSAGHFQQPMGVALDTLGNVFVSDPLNFNVQEFLASTGSYLAGLSYQRPGYLSTPLGLAVDNKGGI